MVVWVDAGQAEIQLLLNQPTDFFYTVDPPSNVPHPKTVVQERGREKALESRE